MADNISAVTTGKPKIGGAIHVAPLGTTLPTDATTALNAAFKSLGYCSEDGLTNANSPERTEIKAWGGDVVNTPQTGKSDNFDFMLIQAKDIEVLKFVYGDSNVTGTLAAGIHVKANSRPGKAVALVVDMILRDDALKRIVIPHAEITSMEDIVYNDTDPVGYGVTVAALPDANGDTHHEYIKAATTTTQEEG